MLSEWIWLVDFLYPIKVIFGGYDVFFENNFLEQKFDFVIIGFFIVLQTLDVLKDLLERYGVIHAT